MTQITTAKINGKEKIESIEQMIRIFSQSTTPRGDWRTGLECELFAVDAQTLKSVPYFGKNGIEGILEDMVRFSNWQPVYEGEHIIGLKKGASNITLEPSGQIELSGAACTRTDDCLEEYRRFCSDLIQVCEPKNILLLPIGYQPVSTLEDTEWIPKSRYQIMSKYFVDKGKLAHHMMKLTCSIQINIDYSSETDFSEKFRLSSYLTPILQAIFAYSPFKQNRPSGFLDYRGYIWEHTDNDRCRIVPQSFHSDFSFTDYVNILLDMPMILMIKEGKAVPMQGMKLRQYLEEANTFTVEDFINHLSFAFFETRVKPKHIEIRMIDAQHPRLVPSVPALIKGLFFDDATRRDLLDFFSKWPRELFLELHYRSHQTGLQTGFEKRQLLDVCREVFQAGKKGLKNLVAEGLLAEEADLKHLDALEELLIIQGKAPAEVLLAEWERHGRDLLKLKEKITCQI